MKKKERDMRKFFEYSLPLLFVLSLAPLALQILHPIKNAEQTLFLWYFFFALANSGNFCAWLCYESVTKSFNKWSILYIITGMIVLIFDVFMAMFITVVF